MRGKSGSGTSLVTGRPASLSSSIAVARCGGGGAGEGVAGDPAREVALHRGRAERARRRASLSPSATSRRTSSSIRAASPPVVTM